MKIPKKLKIMHRTYKVVRSDEVYTQYNEQCWGLIDYDALNVVVRNRDEYFFQEEKEAETFLHEIIHGVDESSSIKLKESQVRMLAIGLITVIRANKIDFLSCE